MASFIERDERCLFIGNLDPLVTEEILWELFLQAGPLEAVLIPKDKETGKQKSYAFISLSHEISVPYTIDLLNGISLYGRPITVKKAQQSTNNFPGNQSPSSFMSPLFDSQNGQSSPHSSPHSSSYGCGISNISPRWSGFDYHNGQSIPHSNPHPSNYSSRSSPNSNPLPLLTLPSPARNGLDNNSPGSYPFARDRWDKISPWQQNGGRDNRGRSQSGHSLSPQLFPGGLQNFRQNFLQM